MRSKIIIGLIIFLIFFSFSSKASLAQDPEEADTVRLANISGDIGQFVSMPVFLYNDEELVSVVIPLLVDGYSGWLRFDSVSYVGSRLEDPAVLDDREVYLFGTDTFTVDSLVLSFSVSSGGNLPAGTGKLCDLWFTLHFGGDVLIDSLSDSPQGGLLLTDTNEESFTPQFSSGLVDISCGYLVGDLSRDFYIDVTDLLMLTKLFLYDNPLNDYPLFDRCGPADLNCDRRLDMRDQTSLWGVLYGAILPCTCGTINPPFYEDPGDPDTVWVESETLIVGISSPICIGVINDEPLLGMALALEWDGSAVLELDWENAPFWTDRIDSISWWHANVDHADGVNPDTFLLSAFITGDASLFAPGRDAVWRPYFIPQSAGTATFCLVGWVNGGQSMLVTEDHGAILPTLYGGNIIVLPYLPGDANHDGTIDLADAVYLINYLFVGGPEPNPYESGDANGDGEADLADAVYLVNYLFIGGPPPCSPIGILINYDGCKEFQKGTAKDVTPPDQDCIEYQYDGENLLLLKHINAGFNCCPDEILADITIENNVITIEENESLESGGCYCLCLFDVDYEISNLPPGEYTIRVIEPYVPEGGEILEFTVDLASSPSDSYCVYRDYYPWGIR
jgi:hypothetical protein